ncbi:uncharacterized protein BXZ73DRAFT_8660, partial [Epithele typhae]|uniref:uncharacterized protein n=1 Tax=Epithele typhae TaxID=378194 RepID=UPI002008C952
LTEEDLEYLRPFAYKVHHHLSGSAFAELPQFFPGSNVASWKLIQARAARLSGFEPRVYDTCVQSCIAYLGIYTDNVACPFCSQSRYKPHGNHIPRATFVYLPLEPRLKALQANADTAKRAQYRAQEHHHVPGVVTDVMDSKHFRGLLDKKVTIGGKEFPHRFFEDPREFALGLSTDGFAPFKRRSKT